MKQDSFWTDEKVKEFYTFCYNNVFKQPTYPEEMISKFKESQRHSGSVEWEIVELKSETLEKTVSDERNIISWIKGSRVGWFIHSVLRKSDNVTFSVGDVCDDVHSKRRGLKIKSFELDDKWEGQLAAIFGEHSGCIIKHLSKLPPERTKLFTTEDGVDVVQKYFIHLEFSFRVAPEIIDELFLEEDSGLTERIKDLLK